jgi:hypothetical protein
MRAIACQDHGADALRRSTHFDEFVLACFSALHYDRSEGMRSFLHDYQPQENLDGLNAEYRLPAHFLIFRVAAG